MTLRREAGPVSPAVRKIRLMPTQGGLDALLVDLVRPQVQQWRERPARSRLYVVRYPEQGVLRIEGDPDWIEGQLTPQLQSWADQLQALGHVHSALWQEDLPEVERYGGTTGHDLALELFHHDSYFCLDWLALECSETVLPSRREASLLLTERWLDRLQLDAAERVAVYRRGFEWALDDQTFTGTDLQRLEERLSQIEPDLRARLASDRGSAQAEVWGSSSAATLIEGWQTASAASIAALCDLRRASALAAPWESIAWSLTHMQCNRLGITGRAEAILRYFLYRIHGGAPVA